MIELFEPKKIPLGQWSKQFLQGMINRMSVGYYRYGAVKKYTGLWSERLEKAIKNYKKTGNTEFMIDAANYCMCEFMYPRHPKAHFECSDSNGKRVKE